MLSIDIFSDFDNCLDWSKPKAQQKLGKSNKFLITFIT